MSSKNSPVHWTGVGSGVPHPVGRNEPGTDGLLRSEVFPGLWLDPAVLLAGDLPRLLEVLNAGLASTELDSFTADLQTQRAAHVSPVR